MSGNAGAGSAAANSASPADIGFEQIWLAFAEVENSERLIEWSIGGVFIWPLLRDRLIREVTENLGVFQRRVETARPALPTIDDYKVPRSDFAVFPFLRRDSAGKDAFSQPIIDSLRGLGVDPLVVGVGEFDAASSSTSSSSASSSFSGAGATRTPHIDQLEALFLRSHRRSAQLALAWSLIPQLGGRGHYAKYQRMISALEARLGVGVSGQFGSLPRWLLVDFWAQRLGWKRFFKAAGVRKVFVVNAWKRALIAGAQAAGAKVVELQHGVLSDKHPLLSWPVDARVHYLPDELYLWGEFWSRETSLPNSIIKTIIGAPGELARIAGDPSADSTAKADRVLIVSQAQQTTRLFDIALRAADANPTKHFSIKPHPQESLEQFEAHLVSLGRSLPRNLDILETNRSALELIPGFEFVVGVHSMALIEAIKLGAKVIVVQLEGWQYVDAIAARGDVTLTPPTTDLIAELAVARVSNDPDYYFAPPLSAAEFAALLQERP